MRAGRILGWAAGPLLAVGLLWFGFRGVDLAELKEQMRHASLPLLALNLLAGPLHLLLRAWRWRTLLRPIRADVPLRETFSATSIGYLAGLLPGRVGEVLRPALLKRRLHLPFGATLATAGVERVVLDLLVILFLGALTLLLPSSLTGIDATKVAAWSPQFQRAGGFLLTLLLLALVLTHLIGRHRESVANWLRRLADSSGIRFVPAVAGWISALLPGFELLASWRGLGIVMGQSLLIWLVTAGGMHAGLRACGVDLPPGGMFILLPVLVAGLSIPTPGNTGTFHLAMKVGLMAFFGTDESVALGAGLVVHLANWIPLILLGSTSIALGGLRSEAAPQGGDTRLGEAQRGHGSS